MLSLPQLGEVNMGKTVGSMIHDLGLEYTTSGNFRKRRRRTTGDNRSNKKKTSQRRSMATVFRSYG